MENKNYQFILTLSGDDETPKIDELSEFIREEIVEIIHKVDMLYDFQCELEVKRNE